MGRARSPGTERTYYECVPNCSQTDCFDETLPADEQHCTDGYPHCLDKTLGGNCRAFHPAAAIQDIEGVSNGSYDLSQLVIYDAPDAIAAHNNRQPNIIIRDSYFADVHDDVAQTDGQGTIQLIDSFVERAFMGLSVDGDLNPTTCGTISYEGSMVELFRFSHAYKERTGHGAFGS